MTTYDPALIERLVTNARSAINSGLPGGSGVYGRDLSAMADQLEAARRTIDSGNEAFRQLRGRWAAERDALRAEVERMRPVVEAAEQYRDGGPVGAGIIAAVDAYRATKGPDA